MDHVFAHNSALPWRDTCGYRAHYRRHNCRIKPAPRTAQLNLNANFFGDKTMPHNKETEIAAGLERNMQDTISYIGMVTLESVAQITKEELGSWE